MQHKSYGVLFLSGHEGDIFACRPTCCVDSTLVLPADWLPVVCFPHVFTTYPAVFALVPSSEFCTSSLFTLSRMHNMSCVQTFSIVDGDDDDRYAPVGFSCPLHAGLP